MIGFLAFIFILGILVSLYAFSPAIFWLIICIIGLSVCIEWADS